MQELEQACWDLDGALTSEKIPLYRRKQIRTAVRDIAMAVVDLAAGCYPTNGRTKAMVEIDRLFPPMEEKEGS